METYDKKMFKEKIGELDINFEKYIDLLGEMMNSNDINNHIRIGAFTKAALYVVAACISGSFDKREDTESILDFYNEGLKEVTLDMWEEKSSSGG